MSALMATDCATIELSVAASRSKIAWTLFATRSRMSGRAMKPYLMTSASPARSSTSGSDSSNRTSQITDAGW